MGVLLAVLTGCGPATTGAQHSARGVATTASPTIAASPSVIGPTADLLSFTYHRHAAGTETIDQQLEIHNSYPHSVLPVLEFTAVDAHGQVMPQVKVASVYGSDRGSLVAPYGYTIDILRFSGQGEHQVADVRVVVHSVTTARIRAGLHYANAQARDSKGKDVSKFSRFSSVTVSNTDDFPVSVRIVYLVYDQPAAGQSQQATTVVSIGGLLLVPAHGNTTVAVAGAAADAVAHYSNGPAVSIKTYNSQ